MEYSTSMSNMDDPYGIMQGMTHSGLPEAAHDDFIRNLVGDMKSIQDILDFAESSDIEHIITRKTDQQITISDIGMCIMCGNEMTPSALSGSKYICELCGYTQNMGEDIVEMTSSLEEGETINLPQRLKVMGADSRRFQHALNKSTITNYSETQRQNIQEEFLSLNWEYRESGNNVISQDVLMSAADLYHQMQKAGHVVRSEFKHSIMASCLYHASLKLGYYRDKKEIARFIGLNKSSARGEDFLVKLSDAGKVDIDVNQDLCTPIIDTIFMKLNLVDQKFMKLKPAIREIIEMSNDLGIGSSSTLKSKVAGAVYIVVIGLDGEESISYQEIVDAFEIRKTTIARFTSEMFKYHSKFVEIYKKYDLNIALLDATKKKYKKKRDDDKVSRSEKRKKR